jgi:hypothetical protein
LNTWNHLSGLTYLQEHDGDLNFATDTWTSPNHKVFVTVTVHFENDGVPVSMILDLVKVAQSHSGINLATVFVDIIVEFGIADNVSLYQRYLKGIEI